MTRFKDWSIRAKLLFLAVASASFAVLLAVTCFVWNDIQTLRTSNVQQLDAQARILAFNATAVLTFDDANAAEQLLKALQIQPSVEVACLYDTEGKLFASFSRGDMTAPGVLVLGVGHQFTDGHHLELVHPVVDDGERVGTLYLRSDLTGFYGQVAAYLVIVVIVMVVALATTTVFAMRLQKAISTPVKRLAETSKAITNDRDYSLRVTHQSSDELGDLCVAFNDMLDQVEQSKSELRAAHDKLEDRVDERTAQLSEEIARRIRVQQDLERAKDAAEAANGAKSRFLANMSHEIRTPLNGILGFADLLLKGADDGDEAERSDYLQTIYSSGKHLLALINDILDLSKIEAGQLETERIETSPQGILASVASVLRVRAREKGLQLECRWSSRVPETIVTDPARLRQLLMNLIGNAIKFTERGSVKVVSRIEQDDRPALVVDVVDTGIGIASEKLSDIFDPFVQADNSVTRRFGGTGLGLAICRRIARALGGDLTVNSELGAGSCFSFRVDAGPLDGVVMLKPADAEIVSRKEAEDAAAAAEDNTVLSSASVLVVDDGASNRKLIRVLLTRAGLSVTTAENGKLGVDTALVHDFDLIIMDMQMPVMDGYTATERLRQQGIDVPIIALTANAMKGDEEKCLQAGCSCYLTKPIDSEKLLQTAAQQLNCEPLESIKFDDVFPADDNPPVIVSSLPTDDPDFREIVEEFIEQMDDQLGQLQQAWDEGDYDQLDFVSHRFRGASASAGFARLVPAVDQLNQLARERTSEEIPGILAELMELASRVQLQEGSLAPKP